VQAIYAVLPKSLRETCQMVFSQGWCDNINRDGASVANRIAAYCATRRASYDGGEAFHLAAPLQPFYALFPHL